MIQGTEVATELKKDGHTLNPSYAEWPAAIFKKHSKSCKNKAIYYYKV